MAGVELLTLPAKAERQQKSIIFTIMGIKHYDKSFKENAVKLSYQRASVSSLSKELGISKSQLSKWRKDYEEYGKCSFPGRGVERLSDQDRVILTLEKELKTSKLELEILKKAIAVFSKIDN